MNIISLPTEYPKIPTRKAQELPKFPVPNGFESSYEYLVNLTKLPEKLNTEEYQNRLSFELEVIQNNGYADYFLIIYDMIEAARNRFHCFNGPGRGSAAGSLVCFLLGITKVDPIKHNLLFERFIQPNKPILPDIDIDFESDRIRQLLLDYLQQKYGKYHVSNIITYNQDKAGNIKTYGIHACGLAIAARSLDYYTPMTVVDNTVVTILDGHYIEDAGVVKLDILHLSMLETIHNVVRTLKSKGIYIDIDSIPTDDVASLEAFKQGETDDIFMFQSKGMKEILRQMDTLSFEDLVNLHSMYRPGPIDLFPYYIDLKKGKKEVIYSLPCMEKNLKDTFGILLYQEQLMLLLKQIAGFSGAESDACRKALGKKNECQIVLYKKQFIDNGINNGHPQETLEVIWNEWCNQALYLFNKSHALCYTLIAYQMMFLKVHFPDEFNKEIKMQTLL